MHIGPKVEDDTIDYDKEIVGYNFDQNYWKGALDLESYLVVYTAKVIFKH